MPSGGSLLQEGADDEKRGSVDRDRVTVRAVGELKHGLLSVTAGPAIRATVTTESVQRARPHYAAAHLRPCGVDSDGRSADSDGLPWVLPRARLQVGRVGFMVYIKGWC
jgi:hypothetical protein